MKVSRIAICFLTVAALAATGYAQAYSTDFEGVSIAGLADEGWVFIDDQTHDVNGVPTQYLDTIQIETTIVHSGTQALRLGVWDLAYFPLNGEFGTLELWFYDYGYHIREYITSANGPRFGFRKWMDVDCSVYYPDNEPVDWGVVSIAYGIGAGLMERTWLGSDGGYAGEAGNTGDQNLATINSPDWDWDGANPMLNVGFPGDQSWYSPFWFGPYFGIDGRPEGWSHWRIAYVAPGQIEVSLLDSPTGTTSTQNPAGANAFDGTDPDGLDDIFLYGGQTLMAGAEPETWFGDLIVDDLTWTPASSPCNPGDADGDGDVDLDDFVILKNNFGTATGATCAEGDFDGDGDVDLDDFVLLKNNFGATY